MGSVRIRTLRAFRNGIEGMVKANKAIETSSLRADELVRAGLAVYEVGGKMEPETRKNKMDVAARGTKTAAAATPTEEVEEAASATTPTVEDSEESQAGGRTGGRRSSRSSSRPARRRKK